MRQRERKRGVGGIGVSGTECGSDSSSGAGIGKIFAANKDEEELQSDGSPGGEGDYRQHFALF